MSTYANIYTGDVNSGYQDGVIVSEGHSLTSPIITFFTVTKNRSTEYNVIKCAIRCVGGYETFGPTAITAYKYSNGVYSPDTSGTWMFCVDNNYVDGTDALKQGTWLTAISIVDVIYNVNTIFWVKTSANINETTGIDTVLLFTTKKQLT